MSLVVACNCRDTQYWCSDSILVKWMAGAQETVSRDYRKVRPFLDRPVLVGLSGSAYDMDLIWEALSMIEAPSSRDHLLESVRVAVNRINVCSANFAADNSLRVYETGAIVGGYWEKRQFLAIVTPDGRLLDVSMYGAIGFGSENAESVFATVVKPPRTWQEARSLIDRCFIEYMGNATAAPTTLDRAVIYPSGIQQMTERLANNAIDRDEESPSSGDAELNSSPA